MTATLSQPAEELLQEQVARGEFESVDAAIEAAVQTVFGKRASPALESLLEEALGNTQRKVPISELMRQA